MFKFFSVKHCVFFLFLFVLAFLFLEPQWHCPLLSGQPLLLGMLVVWLWCHQPLRETLWRLKCEGILQVEGQEPWTASLLASAPFENNGKCWLNGCLLLLRPCTLLLQRFSWTPITNSSVITAGIWWNMSNTSYQMVFVK